MRRVMLTRNRRWLSVDGEGRGAERPALDDGCFALSENPGFGWELDEEFVGRYRVDG
ncbi:MAG: hypothetical protein ACR2HI_10395 [Gaiella sp.]